MKKVILISTLCLFIFTSTTPAEFDIKLAIPDSRISDRKVYLRHNMVSDTGIEFCEIYLPKGEIPGDGIHQEMMWVLVFDNAEILRQCIAICKYNKNGTKITVKGLEVQMLHGRGMLISSIKSNW